MKDNHTNAIEPLTKVALSVRAISNNFETATDDTRAELEFICGLATEGLTGFELDLIGKNKGDCLSCSVDAHKAAAYFEHLLRPLLHAVQTHPPFDLALEVLSISAATERELVHALSQKVENSGCGGDCGCGCE